MSADLKARRLALRRRKRAAAAEAVSSSRAQAADLTDRQRAEPRRGWYACCEVFYVGFGHRKTPVCPACDKRAHQATVGEVEDHGRTTLA